MSHASRPAILATSLLAAILARAPARAQSADPQEEPRRLMREGHFVGEPTGSCPRFVGESTWFVLPHSDTRVYCSSRQWQVLDSTDQRCWVPPQIVAEPTWADYAAGSDPALQAIHDAIGRASSGATTRAAR